MGVPQGSPVSPVLFNMYIAPLLHYLEKIGDEDMITPTFVDDVTLAIAAETKEAAMERAEEVIRKMEEWGDENGISFERAKMEWIGLGKRQEDDAERIEMPGGEWKEEAEIVRWLGVWIDRKMKFDRHVAIKVESGARVASCISRLGQGKRGIGIGNARKMYIACARGTMDYGARVWWNGQKGLAGKMDKAEEKAMRKIGGHFRTAPGAAISVENDMMVAEARLNARQKRNIIKAMRGDPRNPARQAVEREIGILSEPPNVRGGKRKKEIGLRKGVGMVNAMRGGDWKKVEKSASAWRKEEKWERRIREELEIDIREWGEEEEMRQKYRKEEKDEVIMYADGSVREGRVGVGVCRMKVAEEGGGVRWGRSFNLGRRMEIMDAEMVGIRKAIEQAIKECRKEGMGKKRITVRVDSQEAMRRCGRREKGKGEMMARKIRWICDAGREQGLSVRLEWVKGHAKVWGNEEADRLAKEGGEKAGRDKEAFVSEAWMEKRTREEAVEEWDEWWGRQGGRRGRQYALKPSTRHTTRHDASDRSGKILTSRLRTGHARTNQYLERIARRNDSMCECEIEEQTVEHILERCALAEEARGHSRTVLGNEMDTKTLLYSQEGLEEMVKIWNEFEKARKEIREGQKEIEEGETKERWWGWGEVERA